MEDILDLYAQDHDPEHPQVCFDEMPYQLIKEKRTPIPPPSPGYPSATTTTTKEAAHATCSCSLSPREGGATWK
jgi:hypothetical protein